MINNTFKELINHWETIRLSLKKNDLEIISKKDTFRDKIQGIFTFSYYRREQLIKDGDLALCYVFKTWNGSYSSNNNSPFWVLHSPSSKVSDDPSILSKAAEMLSNISIFSPKNKEESSFLKLLQEPYGDASFVLVPAVFSGDALLYLSIVYLKPQISQKICLGFNPFICNKGISDEILFLPDNYWTEEFKKLYYSFQLV